MEKISVTLIVLHSENEESFKIKKTSAAFKNATVTFLKKLRKERKSPGPIKKLFVARDEAFAGLGENYAVRNKFPDTLIKDGERYYIF